MVEHGGDIDNAIKTYGGRETDWIDLSTGINPQCYPIPKMLNSDWRNLPTASEMSKLEAIIKSEFNTSSDILFTPGSQIAINLLPILLEKQEVCILEPTYSDYRSSFLNARFNVHSCKKFEQLFEAKIAIVVNPNNPDGRSYMKNELINLSKNIEMLIIDESFIEATETESIISDLNEKTNNIIVIKSFGKFFGLAGLRFGLVLSGKNLICKFKKILGSWPVSKGSIKIVSKAIKDKKWINQTKLKLRKKVKPLDDLMKIQNFKLVGGTNLFRLYSTPNSFLSQKSLAKLFIWSRIFSYSKNWLRLGIPSDKDFKKIKDSFKKLKT